MINALAIIAVSYFFFAFVENSMKQEEITKRELIAATERMARKECKYEIPN